jgi:hypothetical protein
LGVWLMASDEMRLDQSFAPGLAKWLTTVPKDSSIDLELVRDGKRYEKLRCEAITPSGKILTTTIKERRDRRADPSWLSEC